MGLFAQFQTLIGSVIFGSVSLFVWTLFNRIFYSKKILWLRVPLEIALFCLLSYLYYLFLSIYSSGVFNIFYIPALLFGCYLYYRFYAYPFEVFFEKTAGALDRALLLPIRLKRQKFRAKLKERKERRKARRVKKDHKKNKSDH